MNIKKVIKWIKSKCKREEKYWVCVNSKYWVLM